MNQDVKPSEIELRYELYLQGKLTPQVKKKYSRDNIPTNTFEYIIQGFPCDEPPSLLKRAWLKFKHRRSVCTHPNITLGVISRFTVLSTDTWDDVYEYCPDCGFIRFLQKNT